jgi:hypothetical protein
MSIFSRKEPPAPEPISGTELLRRQLISRVRRRSLIAIAGDINDLATTEANRATAKSIANNMAAGASPDVAASLARTLLGNMPSASAETKVISDSALQAFVDGGDLSNAGKIWLVRYLDGDHKTFDAGRDEITLANPKEPATYTHAPQWRHPDPRIEQARAAYHAAVKAARAL